MDLDDVVPSSENEEDDLENWIRSSMRTRARVARSATTSHKLQPHSRGTEPILPSRSNLSSGESPPHKRVKLSTHITDLHELQGPIVLLVSDRGHVEQKSQNLSLGEHPNKQSQVVPPNNSSLPNFLTAKSLAGLDNRFVSRSLAGSLSESTTMKEQMYISCGKKDDSSTQPLGDLGESPAFSRPLPTPEMQGVTDHVLTADEAMPNNIPDSQTTLNLFNSISLPAPQSPLRRNIQSPTASPLNGIIFQDPTALFTPPGSLDLPLPQTPVPLAPSQAVLNAPPSVASSLSPIPSTSPQRALSHSASFSQTPIVMTSSHVAELHVPQEQGVIDSNHGGYRLRQRKPINLMPFKIDKAKYKRQLRSNPEAIVEFQSPSRRHRKAPQLMSSDVEPSDDREASLYSGNSDGERMRSRKGKERAHEEDGPLPGPSTQQSPVEGPRKWYPAAFDLMSSSGDEEFGDLPRLPKPVPPRKPKHRRLQPFPMKGILLHHSPAHGGAKAASTSLSKNSPEAFRLEIDPEPADVISGSSGRRSPPRQGHDLPSDDERDSGDAEIPHHQVASGSSNGFRSSGHEAPPTSSFIDLTDISPSKFLHRRVTSTKSSSGSESSVDSRIAILQRLYPARMVERMLQRDTKRMTQTAKRKPQFDFDDTPVLPGQARIRKAAAPLDREIRGDSVSSDVEGREASPLVESSQGSVISISSDADEDDLEIHSPVTGIWDLRVGLARNAEAMEWDQIDYMLSRTSTTGKKRRSYAHHKSRQSGQGRSSGFKATVITDSARRIGPARQTLLPFNHQVGPSRTTVSNRNKTNAISLDLEGHGIEEDLEANPEMPAEVNINISEDDTRIAQGFRPRTKKKPRNLSGLHIFTSNQHHITSGRNVASYVTIDVEDESANHLLQHPNRPPRVQNPSKRRHMKHRSAARLEDFWLPQPRDQDRRNSEPPFPPADRIINAKYPSRKSVDFDAPLLPSGITFAEVTYLAKGYLHELLSLPGASGEALRPAPLSAFDCEMSTFSSASIFAENLGKLGDTLLPLIVDPSSNSLEGARLDWERNLHHTSQHVSWFLVHSCPDDLSLLNDTITNFLLRFEDVIEEHWTSTSSNGPPDPLTLELQWFAVELSWRTQSTLGSSHLNRMVQLLTRTLWIFGLEKVVKSIILEEGRILDSSTTPQRAAEIWICLIYLSQLPGDQSSSARHLVWDALRQILQGNAMQRIAVNELELSRWIWQGIFGLCAFSQFSVYGMVTSTPRLMPSWDIIASTLKHAPLAVDRDLPRYALRKRDKYVRLLVSRCMLLNSRWKWRLDRASPMFASLHTIFKSRQFSNLSDETADFPSFLRRNNPELLSDHQRSDTAFTLFLKLVVQAAKEAAPSGPAEATLSPMVKKFLSLAVPVGTVQFTKASPPSPHEISMLYNRFSAIAVAIYLEPTQSEKLVDRVRHHYLDFGKADRESRRACIRGALHLAILLQHLHLPLFGVLAWMGEMTDILVDEYRKIMPSEIQAVPRVSDKPSVVLCIQMLLRSIQRIVNTPLVSAEDHAERYPDPSLLQGPWVTRVFSTETDLTTIPTIAFEVRTLVQTFLNARASIFPKPQRPPIAPIPSEDSQESQEDYWHFDGYMDDPELLAVTGAALSKELQQREMILAEVIDLHISPAIYRLVCKQFHDLKDHQGSWESLYDIGLWVDCWVGCASVIVRNKRRDWSLYFNLGRQSWQNILDTSWRRRVGLRFMFRLLQVDPMAYPNYQEQFLEVLFESLVANQITQEHEYVALMFSIDGLRHLCLQGLPYDRPQAFADFKITKAEFLHHRVSWIDHIFSRISISLASDDHSNVELTKQVQISITCTISLLSALQDNHERTTPNSSERDEYSAFYHSVKGVLSKHPTLRNHARIRSSVCWPEMLS